MEQAVFEAIIGTLQDVQAAMRHPGQFGSTLLAAADIAVGRVIDRLKFEQTAGAEGAPVTDFWPTGMAVRPSEEPDVQAGRLRY